MGIDEIAEELKRGEPLGRIAQRLGRCRVALGREVREAGHGDLIRRGRPPLKAKLSAQEMFRMHFEEKQSLAAIARAAGVGPGVVRRRIDEIEAGGP